MNTDILKGRYQQIKGQIRQEFGRFTDQDMESLKGRSEQILGVVQERYGHTRDEAAKAVDAFVARLQREGVLPSS